MNESESLLKKLSLAVINGNKDESLECTNRLLEIKLPANKILHNGLLPGMEVVGNKFRENIIFVPQVLISARAMKSSLAILEPLLSESKYEGMGTIVIGTVKGDIHDIGKNIVSMMLRSNGFKVVDLGINVAVDKFIESIRTENANLIGMSALLTTTMVYMKDVIEEIKSENLAVKIMVGGAPLSQAFANQIAADAYANNASDAVKAARELLGKKRDGYE